MIELTENDISRFWSKIDKLSDDCWIWRATWSGSGKRKPVFVVSKIHYHAGKLCYQLTKNIDIEKTQKFIRLCKKSHCINPDHIITDSLENRFWMKVDKNGAFVERLNSKCWKWLGAIDDNGYGYLSYNDIHTMAHYASMQIEHGSVPKGCHICHHCDNPPCTNPEHLYFGNAKSNADDRQKRGKHNPARGEDATWSKLTNKDVLDIRARVANGERQIKLSREYKVSKGTVSSIVNRVNWKHI